MQSTLLSRRFALLDSLYRDLRRRTTRLCRRLLTSPTGCARQCPATLTFYALFNVLFRFSSNTMIVRLPVSHFPAIVFLFSESSSRVGKFV